MDRNIFPFLWMRGEPEEILRREIGKIAECGIHALCVEARPHDDFCGPGWWHDMDIVLEEARARDMKVWILDDRHFPTGYANGLIERRYPERKKQYINCTTADILGPSRPLTLNVGRMLKPTIGFWQIGEPVDYEEQARNTLLAAVALPFEEGDRFHEEAIDLTDLCRDGTCQFTLPEGQWRVHVIYRTRLGGGNPTYINMLDRESAHTQIEGVYEAHWEHYREEFGKTIAGFFSDEPQFGNLSDQCFDTRLGRRKMALPWSGEMESMLKERWGEQFRCRLPLLFADTAEGTLQPLSRYDYMDCASRLYEQNFSRTIGDWCREHGVEYIGHVVEDNSVHSRLGLGAAHYFRAMAGQDMAGVDVIGGQYYFGAPCVLRRQMVDSDGEFTHFALVKMGASAGHLDPRKHGRTMCELFGAYGWGFGVRDMKHLLDFVLAQGVNYLVPHAFSMAQYPDIDCPPHFYAGGNNPQFPWFAQLMHYAQRMCSRLSGGTHVASCAVLYDGEADWAGERMPMQKVCRALLEQQIDFEIVPLDMLCDLASCEGSLENGILTINQIPMGALIVPQAEYIPARLARFVAQAQGLPVLFAGSLPKAVLGDAPRNWADRVLTADLSQLAEAVRNLGLGKMALVPQSPSILAYHYEKDGRTLIMLVNGDPEHPYAGKLTLPGESGYLVWDAMADRYDRADTECAQGETRIPVVLEPGESLVLVEDGEHTGLPLWHSLSERLQACRCLDLSRDWTVSRAKALDYPHMSQSQSVTHLQPVSDTDPTFSGVIRYEKTISLPCQAAETILLAENVYEVMTVSVNGTSVGSCLTPPYAVSLGSLPPGESTLTVEVATTPAREQMNFPQAPFDFSHEALEPTGMFGSVQLFWR